MNPLIITHANCADGMTAAYIAHLALKVSGERPEIVFVNYGDPTPEVKGRSVFILDFSYPRQTLLKMKEEADQLLVLDHHKTAREELAGLDFCQFNEEECGALMTWKFFFQDIIPTWLVQYVNDRDLWNWKLPKSREVSAAISIVPKTIPAWAELAKRELSEVIAEGELILAHQNVLTERLLENAELITFDDYPEIPCVNSPIFQSELGNLLCKKYNSPFSIVWFTIRTGERVTSLRSLETGVDVSKIARAHGGGGHTHAAGFKQ